MSGQVSARSGQPVTTGYPYSGDLFESWDVAELFVQMGGEWPVCPLPQRSRLPAAAPAAARVLAQAAPPQTVPATARERFLAAMVKAALRPQEVSYAVDR